MTHPTIPCDVCREILSAASDGEGPLDDPAAVTHLATCAACREFQDDLDLVRSALHRWADEVPPGSARRFSKNAPRSGRVLRRLAAAAALVVAVGAGFAGGRLTAPTAEPAGGPVGAAPSPAPTPLTREWYVVPDRNETYSTIALPAIEARARAISDGSEL